MARFLALDAFSAQSDAISLLPFNLERTGTSQYLVANNAFRLGHVHQDDYKSLLLSDKLIDAVSSSLTQCAPECSTCVFESHCGADPVYHYATQSRSTRRSTVFTIMSYRLSVVGDRLAPSAGELASDLDGMRILLAADDGCDSIGL